MTKPEFLCEPFEFLRIASGFQSFIIADNPKGVSSNQKIIIEEYDTDTINEVGGSMKGYSGNRIECTVGYIHTLQINKSGIPKVIMSLNSIKLHSKED